MSDHEARARDIAKSYMLNQQALMSYDGHVKWLAAAISQALREAEEAEREACAKIFDGLAGEALRKGLSKNTAVSLQNWQHAAYAIRHRRRSFAASIRSRGEKDNG